MAKVYKKLTVTLTKELIVGIDESRLTDEALEAFSSYMWNVDSPEEIFETVGDQYVRCSTRFIEGVGEVESYNGERPVSVEEVYEGIEVEIEEYTKEEM